MTTFAANALRHPIGASANENLSPGTRGYGVDYWPVGQSPIVRLGKAPVNGEYPVSLSPREIGSSRLGSFLRDYYYRVHVEPPQLDMGNLVSTQVRDVYVWNAWPDRNVTLAEVQTQNAGGIELAPPGAVPMAFHPLQERVWQIRVTPDGPPVIDATIRWVFAGDVAPMSVHIVGNRLTAWMVPPDWATNVTETLAWLTDVQQAYDGSQTRLVCREAPRRTWEFSAFGHERERQIVEAALYDWTARRWALPVWTDVTWLKAPLAPGLSLLPIDTGNLDYRIGGLAVLWSSPWLYELVEIGDIAAGALVLKNPTTKPWSKGDRLYPCRTATLTDAPNLTRLSSRLIKAQVRFMAAEPCDCPAVAPAALYLGYPVLETRTDESEDIASAYGRQMTLIDNDIGIPLVDDPTGLAWPTQEFHWLLHGREARAAHRNLLYWLQGRANALWLPTWMDDIELAADVVPTTVTLDIEWIGYTRFLHQRPGRQHLRIELKDGTVFYRRVTASTEVDGNNEKLAIDSALGRVVTRRQIRQISWLMLATLNTDSVEIGHVNDSIGIATATATFVAVPREEP